MTATETTRNLESVMNVTINEAMVLDCLAMNCYGDQNYSRPYEDRYENYGATWSHSILDTGSKFKDVVKPKSLPGIVASLSKKGLVDVTPDSGHGNHDASVGLTRKGFDKWLELYPREPKPVAPKATSDDKAKKTMSMATINQAIQTSKAPRALKRAVAMVAGTKGSKRFSVYSKGEKIATISADSWLEANESAYLVYANVTAVKVVR